MIEYDKDQLSEQDAEPSQEPLELSMPDEAEMEPSPASMSQEAATANDEQFEALRRERDEFNEKYIRALADHQNAVRRSHQEASTARNLQLMEIGKAVLTLVDHFDHALETDPETTTVQGMLDGVQILRDELVQTLERFGIHRMTVQPGEEFDPNRHESLCQQPAEGLKANCVVTQIQPGYLIGEKTLRPAKVSVSS